MYVLTSGCAWRMPPHSFGVFLATAHRRFIACTRAGVFARVQRQVLDRLGAAGND